MKRKALNYVLASTMLLGVGTLASCGEDMSLAKNDPNYAAVVSDSTAYDITLGKFEEKYAKASEVTDLNERFVLMAEAEADLLASGVFVPTTTKGGAYTLSRAAFRSAPYVQWGPDADRLHSVVVTEPSAGKTFITKEDREALKAMWEAAVKGEGDYDVPAIKAALQAKGYTVGNEYKTSFSTLPQTFDALATSRANDTDFIILGLDGLVQYDNLGNLKGRMADLVDGKLYEVSEDGKEVTFTVNASGAEKWVKSDGTVYGAVTADDFVAGFQHMLDSEGGLEWLVEGVIENASEYIAGKVTFDKVGVKAEGNKLTYKLCSPIPYFETMLSYSIFFPMNRAFFLEQGGKFGAEFGDVKGTDAYTYGKSFSNILYNGAYICKEATAQSKIVYEKNAAWTPGVWGTEKITYAYDAGEDPTGSYAQAVAGDFAGITLTNAILPSAEADGNKAAYAYKSDTDSTTYFGGWNLNRRTFALENGNVASPKTSTQARAYAAAILNQNFRTALSHSIDRVTMNAVSRGTELAKDNLRNMYTSPNFVKLSAATEASDGHEFGEGTYYGEMVQYFMDKNYNGEYKVADGEDGWYNKELAQKYVKAAEKQLGADFFAEPVQIDIEYYANSVSQKGQAEAVKASIEDALTIGEKQYVQVNLIEATTTDDYYDAGYYAPTGHDADYDLFYGSGWGPDYGDPSTYLDTYTRSGYMIKVQGLNNSK